MAKKTLKDQELAALREMRQRAKQMYGYYLELAAKQTSEKKKNVALYSVLGALQKVLYGENTKQEDGLPHRDFES